MKKTARNPTHNKKNKLLRFLVFSSLFILILLFIYILSEVNFNRRLEKATKNTPTSQSGSSTDNPEPKVSNWTKYENKNLGFSMEAPGDLVLNESGPHGDYYDFIRFEEAATSLSKGINVGVSESRASQEINKVKSDFQKSGIAELVEEKNIVFNGFPATRLYYIPKKENSGLEERMVLIVQKDKFTYSVSTTPEQMNKLMEGFKFISIDIPTPTASDAKP